MTTIKPRGNRVLIDLEEAPQTFAGGLLEIARLPDGEGEYRILPERGEIMAVGPDVQDLAVGDRVICHKYNGVKLPKREWGGNSLMLIREDNVIVKYVDPDSFMYGETWGDRSPRKR